MITLERPDLLGMCKLYHELESVAITIIMVESDICGMQTYISITGTCMYARVE